MDEYGAFLERKSQLDGLFGFDPEQLPDALFGFQAELTRWALRKGRAAILADCGLGKTLMELSWADAVARHEEKPVIILTPLAVAAQTISEAAKFGIAAARSHRGELTERVIVSNYDRLHLFDPDRFAGVVCDESAVLKSFEGSTRAAITQFLRKVPYRLLGTATAAPNDYTELGTSSEALGYFGYMDMLGRFFTNRERSSRSIKGRWRPRGGEEWRFKGHAEQPFWRWVASWARALRTPSDLGFDDTGFLLPPLTIRDHLVESRSVRQGMLFDVPAQGLAEVREERKRTVAERCEAAAALVNRTNQSAVMWCHRNDEGDTLERLIPDAIQVSGKDDDATKEAKFDAFSAGSARVLIVKPVIGAWGLNWQHCAHIVYFPDYSYERYYQAIRRCWRFGQQRPVIVDVVATAAQLEVQASLQRKAEQADRMFTELVAHMRDEYAIQRRSPYRKTMEVPTWLSRP